MMDCDRAFLSLIDNRSQFICAEMTRYQPLGSQDPAQPLLLGIARIALEWGVCPYTMSVFHGHIAGDLLDSPYIEANESYFYIKDFRQVPSFAIRPFVAGYPHMVSYIEIPLTSINGHILGSYCVVDNKRRDFLDPKCLATMREVTSAISSYLDLKRVEGSRTRSERMMDGLRHFIGSEKHIPSVETGAMEASGPQPGPFDLDLFRQAPQRSPNALIIGKREESSSPDMYSIGNASSVSTGSSLESQFGSLALESEAPSLNTPDSMPSQSSAKVVTSPSKSTNQNHSSESATAGPRQPDQYEGIRPNLSNQVYSLFSKASDMIGYAMNLDGLVFLDAITSGTQYMRSGPSSLSPDDERLHTHHDDLLARPLAEYIGDDTADKQLVRQPRQSLIRRLILRYPQGHVFAVDEHGVLDYGSNHGVGVDPHSSGNSAARNEWGDLFECVPKARYAIFLPLWHYQRESCFATCLAWVSDTGKTLDTGDINSLSAFGNSLMAEILRLEALTNTRSKSDFVSTISHELRSPLHGILATVELMQESTRDSQLLSMLDMIESCSSTLLDTFNHLLEFSRINSRASDLKDAGTDQIKHHISNARDRRVAVDLSSLIEDVLETVSLGHLKLESSLGEDHQDLLVGHVKAIPSKPVLVTTHFERHCNWVTPIDKGAWKRIIMNIFSNALKYTKAGHIDIALSVLDKEDNGPRHVSLSVTDTGVGMSREFLKYHLFTPFMQENDLTPGTGLGLSIVKSIVESLDGRIFVESRQHEGTCVTVEIPFDEELESTDQTNIDNNFLPQNRMRGLSLGLVSLASQGAPTNESTLRIELPSKMLEQSIRNICDGKFGMEVVYVSKDSLPNMDILLLDTCSLTSTDNFDLEALIRTQFSQRVPRAVVILGNTVKGSAQISNVVINSPITAKKLWAAFLEVMNTTNVKETASQVSSPGLSGQGIRVDPPPEKKLVTELISPSIPKEHTDNPGKGPLPQAAMSSEMKTHETSLPLQESHSQEVTPKAATNPATECRFQRFLLVDDNAINLKILVAFAKRLCRPFSTATDGAEAVRLYQEAVEEKNPFDCVLMDISMPVMNGFQAVAAIRRIEDEQLQQHGQNNTQIPNSDGTIATSPAHERSYILALTGLGSEQARSSAKDFGFDGFFLKPMKFQDLVPLLGPI
jgi:signal transduction histidine kinase/CheY-like chemotaxis protein